MQSLKFRQGHPWGDKFVFEFDSEDSARSFFNCSPKDALLTLQKWGCSAAVARFAGTELVLPLATIEMMASAEPLKVSAAVQLFFADGSLPATILRAATDRMESDERFGIVRLSDGQQVIMSSGMSGVLLSGVGIGETTSGSWKRPEFWHPGDLADFERDWRRQMNVEGHVAIERRYRIHRPGSSDPWEWYTSNYRLLQGEDGLLYHLGVFVGRG